MALHPIRCEMETLQHRDSSTSLQAHCLWHYAKLSANSPPPFGPSYAIPYPLETDPHRQLWEKRLPLHIYASFTPLFLKFFLSLSPTNFFWSHWGGFKILEQLHAPAITPSHGKPVSAPKKAHHTRSKHNHSKELLQLLLFSRDSDAPQALLTPTGHCSSVSLQANANVS